MLFVCCVYMYSYSSAPLDNVQIKGPTHSNRYNILYLETSVKLCTNDESKSNGQNNMTKYYLQVGVGLDVDSCPCDEAV